MILSTLNINPPKEATEKSKNPSRLTASETQRNIGSVTFFLDAKSFEENPRAKAFSTPDLWLPIRDITVAPNAKLSVSKHFNFDARQRQISSLQLNAFQP